MTDDETTLATRIEDTLAGVLAETGGGFIESFYLVCEFVDADGDHGWLFSTPDRQLATTSMGLVEWAKQVNDYEAQAYLDGLRRAGEE